jgi:hypothetical protein
LILAIKLYNKNYRAHTIFRYLIQHGANIHHYSQYTKDSNQTPLHEIIDHLALPLLHDLIDLDVDFSLKEKNQYNSDKDQLNAFERTIKRTLLYISKLILSL